MRKKTPKQRPKFGKTTLVAAINAVDDLIDQKDVLPSLAVSYLYRVRRILRWHLRNSTGPGNGSEGH